jgi:YVTN family beta-propeller protein
MSFEGFRLPFRDLIQVWRHQAIFGSMVDLSTAGSEKNRSSPMTYNRSFAVALASVFCLTEVSVLRAGPTQSSPIAVSDDDQFLVNVNPDANSISIFDVTVDPPEKLGEVKVGRDPSSVAIDPAGTAYVANSLDGTVTPVELARKKKRKALIAGAEPMAVALTPNGKRLYVANSASNTVSVFDTTTVKTPTLITTIDVSAFGTAPRSLAITDDGDTNDLDETVFVGMFFGQLRPGKSSVDEGQDDQREGRIVAISTLTNMPLVTPNPVTLGPIANAGFNSNGKLAPANALTPTVASTNPQTFTTPTGAFPNQLAAIALHPTTGRAYVVSTGASPNGPLRFNQMAQGLVSVFDAATRTELTSAQTDAVFRRTAPLNLNQGINLSTTPAPRLFLTNPVAMAWRSSGTDAWVLVQNSNLLVRLTADGAGIPTIGAPLVAGPSSIVRVDLQDVGGDEIPGKAPRGLAISNSGARVYVFNFVSRSISVVDITNPTAPVITSTVLASKVPKPNSKESIVQLGAELFFTGRGPGERMSSESWGACIVCHPNGRADGVTWMFDAGPRQTINLDGMFDPKKKRTVPQRALNWSAVRDENHDFELNTRGVFGGRGLIDDDRLFFAIGGESAGGDVDAINQFQQFTGVVGSTNDFSGDPLPPLPGGRRDFGIATLGDARVFVIGGRSGAAAGTLVSDESAVLEFDPRTNQWRSRSSSGFTPRHSLGAAAVRTNKGFRIYAIGGYEGTDPTTAASTTVEEFDPEKNKWRTVAILPTGVAQFGITVAGGLNTAEPLQLIHAFSGNKGTENAPALLDNSTYNLQRFEADPLGPGTWSTESIVGLTPRRNHGLATATRGVASRVFVIGGQDAGGTVLATVEEYQAQAAVAVATPHTSLPAPRARFGIGSSLSTNQIYVIGGVDDAAADQTSIFEYTIGNNGAVAGPPGTPSGTWVTRGNLPSARHGLAVNTPPPVTNFLPLNSAGRDARQDAIKEWVFAKVRPSKAPVPLKDGNAQTGRLLFGQVDLVPGTAMSCATCHGGPKWTRSAIDYKAPPSPDNNLGLGNERIIGAELRETRTQGPLPKFPGVLVNVGTFTANSPGGRVNEIRFNGADISQAIAPLGANGFNIPSLLSVHETAPYFHSGLAQTLEEVLNGSLDSGPGGTPVHFVADESARFHLIQFLRSIDEKTPTFK